MSEHTQLKKPVHGSGTSFLPSGDTAFAPPTTQVNSEPGTAPPTATDRPSMQEPVPDQEGADLQAQEFQFSPAYEFGRMAIGRQTGMAIDTPGEEPPRSNGTPPTIQRRGVLNGRSAVIPVHDFGRIALQPKLTVGQPNDAYEQEADRVAAQVMRMPESRSSGGSSKSAGFAGHDFGQVALQPRLQPIMQRKCAACEAEEEEEKLMRKADGESIGDVSSLEGKLAESQGSGSPLPDDVRSFMEPRFGFDFSQVRIHADSNAVQMNRELGAQAFAYKNDIFYSAGRSPAKDDLTAHELTHVIQQTGATRLNKELQQPLKEADSNEDSDLQSENFSNSTELTVQNKLLGSALSPPPIIQAKADPGQTLERLKNKPPTDISDAYDQAQTESEGAWQAKKNELEGELPEIPVPTGLPAQEKDAKKLEQQKQKEVKQNALKKANKVKLEKEKAAKEQKKKSSQVQDKKLPPSKPVTPTRLQGGNSEQDNRQLSQDAQNELDNVRLDTSEINTDAGSPPTVDTTGDADPRQVDTSQQDSNKEVQQAKSEAAKDISKDFGENDIHPKATNEKLKARKKLIDAKIRKGKQSEPPTVPPEAAGELNNSLAPHMQEKIGAEQQKYDTGKQQFDRDVDKAKTESDNKVETLDQEARDKQTQEQQKAKSQVEASRKEWEDGLNQAEQDYQRQADGATQEQRRKIDTEHEKGNRDAQKHFDDAERDAEAEKQKAERDADREKENAERESGGFLDWVQSAAQALIDGLKEAINFIFEQLRQAVKAIFEAAKELALAAIELARQAIVGLIEAFGDILQRLVDVVFAAFPALAERINRVIEQAVNAAVDAVNTVAEALKQGVTAALDFLANAVEQLLAGIQAIYNAVLDGIGMIVNGIIDIIRRLGYLANAASQMPDHFMGQLSEEVLGMDLSQPLPFERSPESCRNAEAPAADASPQSSADPQVQELLNKSSYTEDDFTVDEVAPFDVDPELLESMNLGPDEEIEFGHSDDPANSMDAIRAELAGGQPEGATEGEMASAPVPEEEQAAAAPCGDPEAIEAQLEELMNQKPEGASSKEKQGEPAQQQDIPEHMRTVGPLSVMQRGRYMMHQMIQGVREWFAANWPYLLAGAIVAIAAFIGLNILTGGAITAALPPLMTIVGAIMIGVAMVRIAGHVGQFLTQGWNNQTAEAAKNLARALAIGAVELIFALLFNAGTVIKALRGGLRASARAAGRAAQNTVRSTVQSARQLGQISRQGARTALKNGRIMLQGVRGGFAQGARSLDDLARRLGNRLRFNRFKVQRQGERIQLLGHINPWVLLANGSVENIESTEITRDPRQGAIVNSTTDDLKGLQEALPRLQNVVQNNPGSQQFSYLHELLGSQGLVDLAAKTNDEILAAFKAAEVVTQNPRLRQLLIERPELFSKLVRNPEAVKTLEQALNDIRREGVENLANAGTRTLEETPLTSGQRQMSEEIQRTTPPEKPTQPGYDLKRTRDENLDELYRQAEEANQELRALTERLADLTQGTPGFRNGLKGRPRALDKIKEYEGEGRNASSLLDIAGSKIVFNSLDELYSALGRIGDEINNISTVQIVQLKDRFIRPQNSGYRDILMNIRMTNGHIAEFRLHLRQFDEVAAIEHDLYDVIRTMETLAEQTSRALTAQETALVNALIKQTQRMYDDALNRAIGYNHSD